MLWLNVCADVVIALSYFIIPVLLIKAMRKAMLPFGGLFYMFAGFIVMCGLTHIMKIITVWRPIYYEEGIVAVGCALISFVTALVFGRMILNGGQVRAIGATILKLKQLTEKLPPIGQ